MSVALTSSNDRISKSHGNNQACLPEEAMTEKTMIWQLVLPTWIFNLQPQTCLDISSYCLDPKMVLGSLWESFIFIRMHAHTHTLTHTIKLQLWNLLPSSHLPLDLNDICGDSFKVCQAHDTGYFISQFSCLSAWVDFKTSLWDLIFFQVKSYECITEWWSQSDFSETVILNF